MRMKSESHVTLRVTQADVDALLDRMDGGAATGDPNARRSTRYRYRVHAAVEFPDQNRMSGTAVACRNISREGAGFLCGHYVYPGSVCRVRLVSEYEFAATVDARVVRCRYVSGTAGIYEVGVAFDSPIDVSLFHREGASARVLLVDADELQRDMLVSLFGKCNADVEIALSPDAALEMVAQQSYEMIVVNHDMGEADGCALVRRVRDTGYTRPITCIACRLPAAGESGAACRDAQSGMCELVHMTREGVKTIIGRLRNEPITSRFTHDAQMAELINRFVECLPDEVRELQQHAAAAAFEELAKRAGRLGALAEGAGFDSLSAAANTLVTAARNGDSPDVRPQLAEVARIAFAARPASATERRPITRPPPPNASRR